MSQSPRLGLWSYSASSPGTAFGDRRRLGRMARTGRVMWSLLAWLGALLGLPACDAFLVSVCQFEDRPGCHTSDAGQPSPSDGVIDPPAPVSTFRRFEWRAKLTLDAKTRFVGLDGRRPILLKTDNGSNRRWEVYEPQLAMAAERDRLKSDSFIGYPTIPALDFDKDRIYRTEAGFYLFDYSQQRKVIPITGGAVDPNLKISETLQVRPFVSLDKDAFMVSGEQKTRIYGKYRDGEYLDWSSTGENYTNFLLGDLDYIDKTISNGLEAMAFSGSELAFLRHQYRGITGDLSDPALRAGVQDAMAEASKTDTGPVQAAYISNINGDEFPDLLFIRGGNFRVISYKGRRWLGWATAFESWKEEVVAPIAGETAQYMALADLTQDGKPDLIVETDKAVHFYMNIVK